MLSSDQARRELKTVGQQMVEGGLAWGNAGYKPRRRFSRK